MNYTLTSYTAFELSTLKEAVQSHIEALENFNKRCIDLGPDMERLASDNISVNKKKLAALYDQRVHILTAFQTVKREENFVNN